MRDPAVEMSWSGWTVAVIGIVALTGIVLFTGAVVEFVSVGATTDTAWHVHLARAEADLGENNLTTALHHWRDAYTAAMASRRSDGLVEIGDFHRRLAARMSLAPSASAHSRNCYLTALLRARGEGSLPGVLRATEAFLEIGDGPMVKQGLAIAHEVALRDLDPQARDRVDMLSARAHRAGVTYVRQDGEPKR